MKYYSLKNSNISLAFNQALKKGLSADKGLYFPKKIPKLSESFFQKINKMTDSDIAFENIKLYVGKSIKNNSARHRAWIQSAAAGGQAWLKTWGWEIEGFLIARQLHWWAVESFLKVALNFVHSCSSEARCYLRVLEWMLEDCVLHVTSCKLLSWSCDSEYWLWWHVFMCS